MVSWLASVLSVFVCHSSSILVCDGGCVCVCYYGGASVVMDTCQCQGV